MFKRTLSLKSELKNRLRETLPKQVEEFKRVKKEYGDKSLGEVKVSQVLGGMRGINGLFYESSKLDANKGILLRNHNLFELCDTLKFEGSDEPLPEALMWLMFTGEIPNKTQITQVMAEVSHRATSINFEATEKMLNSLPSTLHPMTQLSMGVLSLQQESKFAEAYRNGTHKSKYWETYYDDSMNLIAVLPRIASIIYNNVFKGGRATPQYDAKLNYAENFANMMGFGGNQEVINYLSHYLVLHSDHEGGNVSAHASSLVSSALSDPFYSYSAGLNG
jgi:citrate synthase